jgi:putative nucleotidyltransferase with HDIG domain
MASDRPHRRGVGAEGAIEHVCQERGAQFDPHVVDALEAVVAGRDAPGRPADRPARRQGVGGAVRSAQGANGNGRDLKSAIAALDAVPAFAPASERALAATAAEGSTTRRELVAAIESDTGLTIGVLRAAQPVAKRPRIANVPDAVAALTTDQIQEAIRALPRAEFPWRTPLEALLHHSRVHAQAVSRAADRIARAVQMHDSDDILTASLLHDVGKPVLARARLDYSSAMDPKTTSPEQRVRQERQALGTDHASLGGLLLARWGLPDRLVGIVAAHHNSEAENEPATFVRLADLVAHQAQGDAVDRRLLLRLASACALPVATLRDVLFDLPHVGGSQRRRAEPSPLSNRETVVLRLLAQGKGGKQIANELGLSTSTVRSHLHQGYRKLGVEDRAQAVLRATEMGWV